MDEQPKTCPWCDVAVRPPFENLRDSTADDDEESDEIVKCWTMQHSCEVLRCEIWCEGNSEADCLARWNRRTGDSHD